MQGIRQADNDRLERGIRKHFVIIGEDLLRRILRSEVLAPILVQITRRIQIAQPATLHPLGVPFTRPAESDNPDIVFVHCLHEKGRTKPPSVQISGEAVSSYRHCSQRDLESLTSW